MWFRSFGRKPAEDESVSPAPDAMDDSDAVEMDALTDLAPDTGLPEMPKINGSAVRDVSTPGEALVDMWDSVGDDADTVAPVLAAVPVAVAEPKASADASAPKSGMPLEFECPVGWLVVIDGPGRGADFPIGAGITQIGRSPDEAVPLDFGDDAIAQYGHASVAYDEKSRKFTISHGGKKSIVRLNGKSVITTTPMKSHDRVRVGDTTLMFVALCSKQFDWSATGGDK